MVARILCTAVALALAAGGFFAGRPAPPNPLDPFGIMFLAVSGAVWFGWEAIRDAYAYRREIRAADPFRLDPMLLRLAPLFGKRPRR